MKKVCKLPKILQCKYKELRLRFPQNAYIAKVIYVGTDE